MKTLLLSVAVVIGSLVSAGCAVTSGQSSVGEFVDDATVTTRVKTRFAQDQQVSAMRIGVETLNGSVQLTGFATSQTEKDKAATIARAVPGVRNVQNNIVVRPAN